jgi:hypothetical protein
VFASRKGKECHKDTGQNRGIAPHTDNGHSWRRMVSLTPWLFHPQDSPQYSLDGSWVSYTANLGVAIRQTSLPLLESYPDFPVIQHHSILITLNQEIIANIES